MNVLMKVKILINKSIFLNFSDLIFLKRDMGHAFIYFTSTFHNIYYSISSKKRGRFFIA